MKIKIACQLTGLTDRTIRHYIEEKIIFPEYTENYLGNRSRSMAAYGFCAIFHFSVHCRIQLS